MPNDERRPAPDGPWERTGWPALTDRAAATVVALWSLGLLLVSLIAHGTPFYGVETDLMGEYLPAARDLAAGTLHLERFAFKGPGYPAMLALVGGLLHGNVLLAARIVSPLAAGVAAWCAWRLAARAAGRTVAGVALLLLLATPEFVRYALEAGTDTPALALMLAATALVIAPDGSRRAALAGLVAALAILTRTNALFLLPVGCALLALRPGGVRRVLAYAGAASLPFAIWWLVGWRAGGLPADRNYLNVAFELYGRGVPWDVFEAGAGSRFHSMLDVLRYDPAAAAAHVLSNLVTQRLADAKALMPAGLALVAAPGVVLLGWRAPRSRALLAHAAACALVLAPVFYGPRFALYLLPVYVAGAGVTLATLGAVLRSRAPRLARVVPLASAAALVAISACAAAVGTVRDLASAPVETRIGGAELARLGGSGRPLLARKPHAAEFARMSFVRLPSTLTLRELSGWARRHRADLLYYSSCEQVQVPGLAALADSGVALPGIEPLAWWSGAPGHFFAVYRLGGVAADSATFARAHVAALLRYESRHAGTPEALVMVAHQLLDLGMPAEAFRRLERLRLAGADDAPIERLRSIALLELGRNGESASAVEASLRYEPVGGWHWAQLGVIRWRQGRLDAARDAYRRAVTCEPANVAYLTELGRLEGGLRDYSGAARTFERALRLSPGDARLQHWARTARGLAGPGTAATP